MTTREGRVRRLDIEVRQEQVPVIVCRGWLREGEAPERLEGLAARTVASGGPLVLDVRGVEGVDARGVGVLAAVIREGLRRAQRPWLIGADRRVRHLLAVSGLDAYLERAADLPPVACASAVR